MSLLFLLERVDELTKNYHAEGGLVVAGVRDEAHARDVVWSDPNIGQPTDEEWKDATVFSLDGDHAPQVFVFPDAGCC